MARATKLKVYRTAIGFHDAYVAAASQKAALQAWGSDKDLFARGAAELVTDEALTAAPLAAPGTIVRRLRGTEQEQIAALPPTPAARAIVDRQDGGSSARSDMSPVKSVSPVKRKPKPRPSREALDTAEAAVTEAERRHATELRGLRQREEELARERRELQKQQSQEIAVLAAVREREDQSFAKALATWRAATS